MVRALTTMVAPTKRYRCSRCGHEAEMVNERLPPAGSAENSTKLPFLASDLNNAFGPVLRCRALVICIKNYLGNTHVFNYDCG